MTHVIHELNPCITWVTRSQLLTDYTVGIFARKVDFGAKLSREETQERATNVGPVKNKEKKRERKREGEREGRRDQKIEVSAPCKDLVLVHADGLAQG